MRWLNTFIALSKKQTRADMIAEHLKDMEAVGVYITDKRTPEQEAMYKEQLVIQRQLGFEQGDGAQNWLRLHQILLDYEDRLKHLESQVGTRKGGGDEIV
jgi:hypothetical protein